MYNITATKDNTKVTVGISYLEATPSIGELEAAFGVDQIKSWALATLDIVVQSRIRGLIEKGETPEAIQATLSNYKPGLVVRVKGNPVEREIAKAKANLIKQYGCSFDDLPVTMQDTIIAKATERGEAIIAKNAQEDEQDVDVDVEAGE